jgi:outer membrane protein assembly factor BamD
LKRIFYKLLILGAIVGLLAGCGSSDKAKEFNKPAIHWYQKIVTSIESQSLDKADEYYISLKSEHARSPLLPTAILMLANAHMNNEEYLLAAFYYDEYNKRFADSKEREYADYMKIKAAFLGVKDVNQDQKLMRDTIKRAETFLMRHPNSSYGTYIKTILVRLHMSQYLLNENIATLYDRTDKPDAAKIYRAKNSDSPLDMDDIVLPKQGMIGMIFD